MTLVELLLVYGVLAVVLGLLVGVSGYVRREAKRRLAEDMVLTLRESLVAYRAVVGRFPPGQADQKPISAFEAILAEQDAATLLANWPVVRPDGDLPGASGYLDPWGRGFRYVTVLNSTGQLRERVIQDGVPIFESAGPDGDFGDVHAPARADNFASDIAMIIGRNVPQSRG